VTIPEQKKVMIFVDVQNILMACMKHDPKFYYDMENLVDLLVDITPDRELVDVCLYTGIPDPKPNDPVDQRRYDNEMGFYTNMRIKHGYRTFTKKTKWRSFKCRECGNTWMEPKHKGVDVALAIDVMMYGLTDQYDVAIIVSGDSDFVPLVNNIRNRKPSLRIEVAQFSWVLGNELEEAANQVYVLDDHMDKFCTEAEAT